MDLTVGSVLDGKVKTITKFGAFVVLPNNSTGMVHISEVANTYVSDIREHLKEGQSVRVKVINIDEAGKISLSVKRAVETPRPSAPKPRTEAAAPKARGPLTFEEKLKQFMSDSDSRIAGCRQYEHKTKSRRR
ncbi:MAG: S1 RNA-binding domain-containing protein [Oscillospiraceae bacterium]|nr:S1 RNA-binding domain-containing protein [Oscillospiraceae bacterium]